MNAAEREALEGLAQRWKAMGRGRDTSQWDRGWGDALFSCASDLSALLAQPTASVEPQLCDACGREVVARAEAAEESLRGWLCVKCGYGSAEHGMEYHPAYRCVADLRLSGPLQPDGREHAKRTPSLRLTWPR